MSTPTKTAIERTPIHQWTHLGSKVLLVKCVEKGGKSRNGFQWPKSGPIQPEYCKPDTKCESGGLFGWPWGLNIGGGRSPDYSGDWIVFAADPVQVFDLGDKAKVAAETAVAVNAEVVYYGDWIGAMAFTLAGRLAWIDSVTKGSPDKATGYGGSSSATGESGSSSATGESGSSSATGYGGSSSATGVRGSSSATGSGGSSSATGVHGSSSATGCGGSSSATGESGSSSATGYGGSSSATGYGGSSSATGKKSVASVTGEWSTIEVGPEAAGVSTAECFYWIVRNGAVLLCRWNDGHKTLAADDVIRKLKLADGDTVLVKGGKVSVVNERK